MSPIINSICITDITITDIELSSIYTTATYTMFYTTTQKGHLNKNKNAKHMNW